MKRGLPVVVGRSLSWFRVLCCLGVLVFSSPVMAQRADARLEAIRVQMDRGQGLFLAGQYDAAAQVFEQGYASFPYSAFLFNAGVCYQKVGKAEQALELFRRYLEKDTAAPDAPQVKDRMAKLEEAIAKAKAEVPVPAPGEASPEAPPQVIAVPDEATKMKSLVVVETEPAGAPVKIYRRTVDGAAPFQATSEHAGWELVAEHSAPSEFNLDVGRYHVVVEKFGEFNRSETDIDVSPGHVHQFKANLSQGAFLGFLRVSSNVPGAYVYVDDDGQRKVAWGKAPHGELMSLGKHSIVVEAPGFEAAQVEVEIMAGDQKEIDVQLSRVGYGVLRLDSSAPEISVSIDGKPSGFWRKGDVALELKLSAGAHEILVSADGFKDLRTKVEVPRGQVLPVRASMIRKYPRGAAWAQAIIAAGLIGASTYFALESDRLYDNVSLDRGRGALSSSDSRLDQGMAYAIGADLGFVAGGLFAGLSVYNFVKDPYPDSLLRKGKRQEFVDKKAELPTETTGPKGKKVSP